MPATIKNNVNNILSNFGLNIIKVKRTSDKYSFLFDIPRDEWERRGEQIYLKLFSLSVPATQNHPLIEGYHFAKKIALVLNGKFNIGNDGKILLQINNVLFSINDSEELFIILEVFINKYYNFYSSSQSIKVIDIGMNVGIASLFFSSKENVSSVYSFELFPYTYNLAAQNFELNSTSKKIKPHLYGLASKNYNSNLQYSSKAKGRMGINGIPSDDNLHDIINVDVEFRDISEVITEIVGEQDTSYFICKMDCEGAEYELIDRLYETGKLSVINSFMIEWHYKYPDSIIKAFSESNFTVFVNQFDSNDSGMIYAIKVNC